MPSTINGIGTSYWGKKNRKTWTAVCEHCHREVQMESYETRLCFVVLFLPIIPLGRKKILDYCPACTRHKMVPLDQWHAIEDDAVRQVSRQASADPDSPEAAMDLHGTLVATGRHDEARKVAEVMAKNFSDNAEVQMHLGAWHASQGRDREADRHFDRALELEPENRAARRAVAIKHIEDGDLDQARKLLSFMEIPGPDCDPSVLFLLARAFQDKGRAEDAMALYEILQRNFPSSGNDKTFRKHVAQAERATGRTKTILPRRSLLSRPAVIVGLVAAVLVIGLWLYSGYRANNQRLHVVNGLSVPVSITFDDGGDPRQLAPNSRVAVPMGEGPHHAVITRKDAPDETVDFEIANGFFERFGDDSVFVLNVDGAASLLWEEVVYSKNPNRNVNPRYRIHFGDEFYTLRDVDYEPGKTPPRRLEVKSDSKPVKKTAVSVIRGTPIDVLAMFPEGTTPAVLMDFVEHHLRRDPGDESLLIPYYFFSVSSNETKRAREFLATGLSHRPVNIEWHRMYQEACSQTGADDGLPAMYDKMLADAPDDSALLYLRGRTEADATKADGFYERAIKADAKNPYPRMARAYRLALRGDLEAARPLADEAYGLKPDNPTIAELFFDIRLALGEYDRLETELRDAREKSPMDLRTQRKLLAVLVAADKQTASTEAHRTFENTVTTEMRKAGVHEDSLERIVESRLILAYLQGKMDDYRRIAQELKDPALAAHAAFVLAMEGDNPAEAEKSLEKMEVDAVPAHRDMLLGLAWSMHGDQAKADQWYKAACEELRKGSHDDHRMADLLEAGDNLKLDEALDLYASWPIKLVWLTALADRAPKHRAAFLELAEKLNNPGPFPYQFLKRTIAKLREKAGA